MLFHTSLLAIILVLTHSAVSAPSANGTGCNKLPGANLKECLNLMETYSNNSTVVPCDATKHVSFTQGSCSIVYRCPDDVKSIAADRVAKSAKGLVAACRDASSPDHLFSAASAVKYWGRICYMKAGNENLC